MSVLNSGLIRGILDLESSHELYNEDSFTSTSSSKTIEVNSNYVNINAVNTKNNGIVVKYRWTGTDDRTNVSKEYTMVDFSKKKNLYRSKSITIPAEGKQLKIIIKKSGSEESGLYIDLNFVNDGGKAYRDEIYNEVLYKEEVPDPLFRAFLYQAFGAESLDDLKDIDDRININKTLKDPPTQHYSTNLDIEDITGISYTNIYRLNLTGGDFPIEKVDRIDGLASLKGLALRDINVSDPFPGKIDMLTNLEDFIVERLHNVRYLNTLVSNPIRLTKLKTVMITDSGLESEIHRMFYTFPSVENMYLYKNKLNGSILPEIGDLITLKVLRLYQNELSGNIPNEISSLTELEEIDLSNNSFSGYEEGALTTQKNLSLISFRYNNLSENDIDKVLSDLVESLNLSGRVNCRVRLSANSAPSSSGEADADTLRNEGWTVETA